MSPTDESRRSPRSRVFLTAILELPDRAIPVVLRDLSEHGALVESSVLIEPDSIVTFRRSGLAVQGRIAWVRGMNAGVAFSRSLNAQDVLRHIGTPQRRETDKSFFRRPALTRQGMSAEEQRWADEMMREPGSNNSPK